MNAKEKAALLAKGEKTLKMLEGIFDRFLQEGNSKLTWNAWNKYSGAAIMLERLGLIPVEVSMDRTNSLFEQYMAATCPKEAV